MRLILLPLPLLAMACTPAVEQAAPEMVSDGATLPTGATIEPNGFASIGLSPPSAYPADPPPMPTQLDVFARRTVFGSEADRSAVWANANGTEEFQNTLFQLREQIAREEGDNFIEVRLIRENGVQGEFLFQRDGDATLRKYTQDPRFVAATARYDAAQLERLQALWRERMGDGAISGLSMDTFKGKIEIDSGLTEGDFRALAARKGWEIDNPLLSFTFAPGQPGAFADAGLEPLVRAFARENMQVGIRLTALYTGRIVLEDGCFRLADEGGKPADKLVMFAYGSQLVRDEEGYLAVRTGEELYRIGEQGAWGGPNGVDENNPEVRELRKVCGGDEIMNVAGPQSERLFALPYPLWVLDYAYTNNITYDAAWDEVNACIERQEKRGNRGLSARDACIDQYNGWDYTGEELPPPPGG